MFDVVIFWFIVIRGRRWRDHPPTRKRLEIEVQGSYAQVLADISQVITNLEARVTGMDLQNGLIRIKTSAGMKSWGERITISFQETTGGIYKIGLESECVFPLTFSDGGKNKRNLQEIVEQLA